LTVLKILKIIKIF